MHILDWIGGAAIGGGFGISRKLRSRSRPNDRPQADPRKPLGDDVANATAAYMENMEGQVQTSKSDKAMIPASEEQEFRDMSNSEIEGEIGYINRSISWTFSRASVDDRSLDVSCLNGPMSRLKALKAEQDRRRAQ